MQKAYVCRYDYETNASGQTECKWMLITDEVEAKQCESYELASLDDLNFWVAATGEIFLGLILTAEGECQWYENGIGTDNYSCGYEVLKYYTIAEIESLKLGA